MTTACAALHPAHPVRPARHDPAHDQAGFTLVELITVILILGVLAAVAIPRYADLQGKARAAKVQAIAGAMKTASTLVKSAALVQPVVCSSASAASVSMEGTSIDLNFCYPQALGSFGSGILASANVPANETWTIDGIIAGGSAAGSVLLIKLSDAATPFDCSVQYTAAANAATPPALAASVGGC